MNVWLQQKIKEKIKKSMQSSLQNGPFSHTSLPVPVLRNITCVRLLGGNRIISPISCYRSIAFEVLSITMAGKEEDSRSSACQPQAVLLEKALRRKRISSWKVLELKLFLLSRGESDKGKKEQLVERYAYGRPNAAFLSRRQMEFG